MDIIAARRSTKKFLPDPIPNDVLSRIVEAGRMAPTGMNAQNLGFYVITSAFLVLYRVVMYNDFLHVKQNQKWCLRSAHLLKLWCYQNSHTSSRGKPKVVSVML